MRSKLFLSFTLLGFSLSGFCAPKLATKEEVETTRRIRAALVKDEKLSLKAQNITIMTVGDDVTLQGELKSETEIKKVIDVARKSAPGKNIKNDLAIDQ